MPTMCHLNLILLLWWSGKKIRVKCNEDDTIGDLKKLLAAQVSSSRSANHITALARGSHCTCFSPDADRHAAGEDSDSEVVHDLQGPYHTRGLRDPRWDGARDVL